MITKREKRSINVLTIYTHEQASRDERVAIYPRVGSIYAQTDERKLHNLY